MLSVSNSRGKTRDSIAWWRRRKKLAPPRMLTSSSLESTHCLLSLLVVERKHPKVTKVEKELKEQQPRVRGASGDWPVTVRKQISNVPMVKDASQKLRDAQSIRCCRAIVWFLSS